MRVYLNGEFLDEAAARVSPADAGLLQGIGAFETLRVVGGVALDLARHLARLADGLRTLAIELPEGVDEIAAGARTLARTWPSAMARMRITVTAGSQGVPTRLVTVQSWQPPTPTERRQGVPVLRAPRLRLDSANPLRTVKCTSYALQRMTALLARDQGAWEALLGNERDELAEGSRSNVYVWLDGAWTTPPADSGCLPGIVRARLLEDGLAREQTVRLDDLARAEGLLLSNSLVGVLAASGLDGHPFEVDGTAAAWNEVLEASWDRD